MRRYYRVLPYSRAKKNPYIGYADIEDLGYRGSYFQKTEPIADFDYKILIKPKTQEGYGNMDDALQEIKITRPIISSDVVNMLNDLNVKNIHFIPVNVMCEDGSINKNYYILQVLSMYNAIDLKNTKIYGTKEHPMYFYEVYDIDKVPDDEDIFTLDDSQCRIFVSERVRKAFIKNKYTGWDFHPLTLSKNGEIIKPEKKKALKKPKDNTLPADKEILESGVIAEIVPSCDEAVNYFRYKDRTILTIENNRRKQRFLMQIKNDENAEVFKMIARDVLLNVWEYSRKHKIGKDHLCDVLLDNYPMVYAVFDEYTFQGKTYLMPISITEAEIIHIEQSDEVDIFDMLKKESIYPFSDFDRESIV